MPTTQLPRQNPFIDDFFRGADEPVITEKRMCSEHGEYESTRYFGKFWTSCPVCREIENKAQREQEEAIAREEKERRWHEILRNSGIPARFFDCEIKTFDARVSGQRYARDFAKNYADGFEFNLETGRSVLFAGNPGTGKTRLAAGMCLSIMRSGWHVQFTTLSRILRRVKDTWHKNRRESESDAIGSFVAPHFLVLDETELQFSSDAERAILFEIFNGRYENRKPTLLISNLIAKDVFSLLGERVTERFLEDEGAVIPFNWKSYRSTPSSNEVRRDRE